MVAFVRSLVTRAVLTWKQHRFEAGAVAVLAATLLAVALIEAARLLAVQVPAGCVVQPGTYVGDAAPTLGGGVDCIAAQNGIAAVLGGPDFTALKLLLQLFPFLAGLALGAPLVAREIEQGTAPLSCALSPSRLRWIGPPAVAMLLLLTVALVAVAFASDTLFTLSHPGQGAHASFQDYQLRGVMDVGWGIAAFALAAALGALFRRTVPALIVAVLVCAFVGVAWDGLVARMVLAPMAAPQVDPAIAGQTGVDMNWRVDVITVQTVVYLEGKPYDGNVNDWYAAHTAPPGFDPNETSGSIDGRPPWFPDAFHTPQWIPLVIHGSEYWTVMRIEVAILLGAAFAFGAAAAVLVTRRKPY